MASYPERRVWLLRRALGLTRVPTLRDDDALLDYLEGCVTVRQVWQAPAQYRPRPDGGAVLWIPLTSDERATRLTVLEEVAHYLCRGGLIATRPPDSRREISLARLREMDEEQEARRWVDAWMLPADVLLQIGSEHELWDVREASGADEEMLRRRTEQLQRVGMDGLEDRAPDPWAAARVYDLAAHASALCPRVAAYTRDAREPVFEWPAPPGSVDAVLAGLTADLAALRPIEFGLRHAGAWAGGCTWAAAPAPLRP